MMDGVGVVPEQTKIRRRRLHPRETLNRLARIHDTGRVAVFGHHPHALDVLVLIDQLFDDIQVWTFAPERHRNHLDAEFYADAEVAVVAGHRTQKRDSRLTAPRPGAVTDT